MITKGFDFPGVTLAAVIFADASLNLPDFRSAERTFQLLTQVAGRAGRGERPGRVIIQTYAPHHYSVRAAREQDYARFIRRELELRRELSYPPFAKLAMVRIEGEDPEAVRASRPRPHMRSRAPPTRIEGPLARHHPRARPRARAYRAHQEALSMAGDGEVRESHGAAHRAFRDADHACAARPRKRCLSQHRYRPRPHALRKSAS